MVARLKPAVKGLEADREAFIIAIIDHACAKKSKLRRHQKFLGILSLGKKSCKDFLTGE